MLDDANIVYLARLCTPLSSLAVNPITVAPSTGESNIVLGDMANALANHIEFDLVTLDGFERLNECFGRTVHIGLNDDTGISSVGFRSRRRDLQR